jgi:radical SAM/Cys-rich protein
MAMEAETAIEITEVGGKPPVSPETFSLTLNRHGLKLERGDTTTLQINVGLLCNQTCKHCHLEAGPKRKELMDGHTWDAVFAFAQNNRFDVIDITGGATELHPRLIAMVEKLVPFTDRIVVRSNLSALEETKPEQLIEAFKAHNVVVLASFPSFNPAHLEAQRGKGVFEKSIHALKRFNRAGYGRKDTGLELNLVSNPAGAFLPPSQGQAQARFRKHLHEKWRISFNNLFTFANMPLGRFRQWLQATGNLTDYLQRLRSSFNPCVVEGLMCRSLMSVAWDGFVYDCDFNLAKGLSLAGRKTHISEINGPPAPGTAVAVSDHCFTCTAGSGFT